MDDNITSQTNEVAIEPKNKKRKIIISVALAVILVATSALIYVYSKNKSIVNSYEDRVYPGTFVLDKDVSGMTKDELHNVVDEMVSNISSRKMNIIVGGKNFEKGYTDFDTTIDYEAFENEVLAFGKDKAFREQLSLIKEPQSRNYEFEMKYNEDKIAEILNAIAEEVKVNPQDAGISVSWGTVNVTPGQVGYELNKDTLATKIKETLVNIHGDELVSLDGDLSEVNPAITTEALQSVDTRISNHTTYFDPGPSGYNVQVGAGKIGNVLLMPGESFSTVDAIGPTTIANGFVEANTYLNGKVVPGLGGGVCQISSTLYNAELKAGIIPDFRTFHEMPVGYVPHGLDATIGDEWPDLTFTNTYDYPIVVNVYSTGNSVTAEFWSNSQATGGLTYVPKSYKTGALSADTYLYAYNAAGECVLEQYLDSSVYKPIPN